MNGRDPGVTIQTMPNRLDSLKWILVAGFAALFALGIVFVWRRPVAVWRRLAGAARGAVSERHLASGRRQRCTRAPARRTQRPRPSRSSPQPQPVHRQTVDREVETSLDGLKDSLFRLELRRQAGTISEEEYARERSRTEEILRELVRG